MANMITIGLGRGVPAVIFRAKAKEEYEYTFGHADGWPMTRKNSLAPLQTGK